MYDLIKQFGQAMFPECRTQIASMPSEQYCSLSNIDATEQKGDKLYIDTPRYDEGIVKVDYHLIE